MAVKIRLLLEEVRAETAVNRQQVKAESVARAVVVEPAAPVAR
jgi:hypothetical protein